MQKQPWKIFSITAVVAAFAVTAGFAVQGHAQAAQYRHLLDNGYQHAFTELTTTVRELDTALEKVTYATTPALFSSLCTQAYSKAQAAQAALGELPYGNVELEQTASFLAKTGDYIMAMVRDATAEQACTQEHRETLCGLSSAASSLSATLQSLQADLDAGAIQPEDLRTAQERLAAATDGNEITAGSAFQTVEADFPEVPSLIYDGPFSEHLSSRTPKMLDGLPQFTQEEARSAAASFLDLRPEIFSLTSDGAGNLPAWGFSALVDGGELYVEVTKQGGQILQVLSSRPIGEDMLSQEEGRQKAAEFLCSKGYQDMKPSYCINQSGILTVHFASVQDGVYCYPDLVKVSVALDNGDVVGFEAEGYLMNHGSRTLPTPTVTVSQAQAGLDGSLTVLAQQLVLIPTDGEYEVLCHEFKCQNSDGGHVLVYVNAITGQQERILLLLEDENGTLVI
ncbi:germination protein YpeB [Flavonifractor hominis]|uniref:Germination protein YpeB n=1 Tax=Flavonifractor hominis TaxID=3133178 RepID=A0ABV1EKX0_9FIRM